ncbi:branched-chain amino acid transporter AzlD [Gilliamella sp. App2-1]|uniref:AzlD domain-containing protein n=1 Tax=Gilliamella sp. App2-1 TaxID=3120230 RepID=UPI0008290E36|nr:AzlD domain-containing protein [Gilliamella apicola]OCG25314.1 branched-chain amino acid transporter AzlD [Gilliamella apicola]
MTTYSLYIMLGCGLVTWLPRVIPFVLIRKLQWPNAVIRFLSYVPLCILTALLVQNLFVKKEGHFPDFNVEYCLATIPTTIVAFVTKNLMCIVVAGMCSMALICYFMI